MSNIQEISGVDRRSLISKIRTGYLYYKKSLSVNIMFSLVVAGIGSGMGHGFLLLFGLSFITAGYLLSIYLYELGHTRQYYLYYNKGISKLQLITSTFLLNGLLLGIASIIITCIA